MMIANNSNKNRSDVKRRGGPFLPRFITSIINTHTIGVRLQRRVSREIFILKIKHSAYKMAGQIHQSITKPAPKTTIFMQTYAVEFHHSQR